MVASFSAAGVIAVGLVALVYALVLRPSRLRAPVRTVSGEQLELQHGQLPRQQSRKNALHTDRMISNENASTDNTAAAAAAAAYEQFGVGAGQPSSNGEQQQQQQQQQHDHDHDHEEQQQQVQHQLFGSDSLFSADDALGLDWAQVRVASQRAKQAKKDKANSTPPTTRKHLDDEMDAPTSPPSTTTPPDYYFSPDATSPPSADLTSAFPLASTLSKLHSRGSQLRAAAPAWTPSGGIMFSLGSTATTTTTTTSLSTPKSSSASWQSAPSKSGKRHKRPKSQSHLITTPSRRTSVKSNPFAALEV